MPSGDGWPNDTGPGLPDARQARVLRRDGVAGGAAGEPAVDPRAGVRAHPPAVLDEALGPWGERLVRQSLGALYKRGGSTQELLPLHDVSESIRHTIALQERAARIADLLRIKDA